MKLEKGKAMSVAECNAFNRYQEAKAKDPDLTFEAFTGEQQEEAVKRAETNAANLVPPAPPAPPEE